MNGWYLLTNIIQIEYANENKNGCERNVGDLLFKVW